ncbi:MAG: hypothetical protein NZL83_01825 [Candidatus Absconditabacterales bacterium]|nr:hypothetical protein [Candidatus Absconditabacterales bacterium]
MRALETDLTWTFPAIKKQVDALNEADILITDKSQQKRSIELSPYAAPWIKQVFLAALAHEIRMAMGEYGEGIERVFFGKIFGTEMDVDLVLIHSVEKETLETIKSVVSDIFRSYFIEQVGVAIMSSKEWEQRYRLADKFVLSVLRHPQIF